MIKTNKSKKLLKIGQYDVNFEWDDSIIVDVDTELTKRLTLMQNGLVSKVENRMWYFGETERQAREALDKIQEDNQQAMEENMLAAQAASSQLHGGQVQQEQGGGNTDNQQKSVVQMPNEVPNKKNAKEVNKKLAKQTEPKEEKQEENKE